jgi:hypothetical protein
MAVVQKHDLWAIPDIDKATPCARSTKDGPSSSTQDRLCPARDPTIPAVLYPPIELASFRPHGHLHLDRRTDIPAICLGTLPHVGVAKIHI